MKSNEEVEFYDTDLAQFPDIEQYKSQLQILKELNPENTPFDKLYDKYFDLAVMLPQMTILQTARRFNDEYFYRVRLDIDDDNEDTAIIQTHSFPPGYVCKENGRANLKGKSVFYCSDNLRCAILESKPTSGQWAHISVWRGSAPRNVKVAICLPYNLTVKNEFQTLANLAWSGTKKHYSNKAKDKFEHFFELHKFIADRFVQENKPYFLTSWFADQILFDHSRWRDYILYPSITTERAYCNMAFHPNSASRFLTLEKVIRAKIISIENMDIKLAVWGTGEIDKTYIKWKKLTDKNDRIFKDYGFRHIESMS